MQSIPTLKSKHRAGIVQHTARFDLEQFPLEAIHSAGIALPLTLQSAVKKRQYEYLMSRYCVKRCFEDLGLNPTPFVEAASDRSPVWPTGFIGSITHTEGWASAIIAESEAVQAIGIDIEHLISRESTSIHPHICRDTSEWETIRAHLDCSPERALTLIFSAKESLYKALHPQVKSFFGFHSAIVQPSDEATLRVELLVDLSESLTRGLSWPLRIREIDRDVFETLLTDLK